MTPQAQRRGRALRRCRRRSGPRRSTSASRAPIRRSPRLAADGSIVGFDIDIGHGALRADGRDLHAGEGRLGRHHPGAAREEVRRDRGLDVDHRGAPAGHRLQRQILPDPGRFVARPRTATWSTPPRAWPARWSGVQRGTIHQAFMEGAVSRRPSCASTARRTRWMLDLSLGPARRGDGRQCRARPRLPQDAGRGGLRLLRREPIRSRDPWRRARASACARRTPNCATSSPRRSTRSGPTASTRRSQKKYFDFDIYGG